MAIRILKIIFTAIVALQALLFAIQNVVNLDAAYQTTAYVLGNQDHVAYTSSIAPSITNSAFIWLALIVILIGEFSAGFLAAKGAFDLWKYRNASAAEFNAAKHYAIIGCGVSIVVWFGLFMVMAAAYFQMWQTTIGAGSYNDAFKIFTASMLVLLYLNQTDD